MKKYFRAENDSILRVWGMGEGVWGQGEGDGGGQNHETNFKKFKNNNNLFFLKLIYIDPKYL